MRRLSAVTVTATMSVTRSTCQRLNSLTAKLYHLVEKASGSQPPNQELANELRRTVKKIPPMSRMKKSTKAYASQVPGLRLIARERAGDVVALMPVTPFRP